MGLERHRFLKKVQREFLKAERFKLRQGLGIKKWDADRWIKQNEGHIEELFGNLQSSNPREKFQLQGKTTHMWQKKFGWDLHKIKI